MSNPVNVVMMALLVAIGSGAALVRLQPPLMRELADWLNARADAEDFMADRFQKYRILRNESDQERS
jgi:hypothetical protein